MKAPQQAPNWVRPPVGTVGISVPVSLPASLFLPLSLCVLTFNSK